MVSVSFSLLFLNRNINLVFIEFYSQFVINIITEIYQLRWTNIKPKPGIDISCTGTKQYATLCRRLYTCQHIWLSSTLYDFFVFHSIPSSSIRETTVATSPRILHRRDQVHQEHLLHFNLSSFGNALEVNWSQVNVFSISNLIFRDLLHRSRSTFSQLRFVCLGT